MAELKMPRLMFTGRKSPRSAREEPNGEKARRREGEKGEGGVQVGGVVVAATSV